MKKRFSAIAVFLLSAAVTAPGVVSAQEGRAQVSSPSMLVAEPQSVSQLVGVGVQGVGHVTIYPGKQMMISGVTVLDAKPQSIRMTIYHGNQAIAKCDLAYYEVDGEASLGDSYSAAAWVSTEGSSVGSCDTDLASSGTQVGGSQAVAGDIAVFSYTDSQRSGVPFFVGELIERPEPIMSIASSSSGSTTSVSKRPSKNLRKAAKRFQRIATAKMKKKRKNR